jgi:hypothetical protein
MRKHNEKKKRGLVAAIGSRSPCDFLVGSRSMLESTNSLLFFNFHATMFVHHPYRLHCVGNVWVPGHELSSLAQCVTVKISTFFGARYLGWT